MFHSTRFLACILCFCSLNALRAEGEWPSWRGPNADGHARETDLPIRWDAKTLAWKAPLPGIGQSSPVIWGDRIFLTSALDKGKTRVVFCVDRLKGTILWKHDAWTGEPEPSHAMNGWASATCVTDGERVVAFFGKGGIHCTTVDGKHLWSRELGTFPGIWGTSACPIIVGDLVIQNCDAVKEAFIVGLDKKTGKTVWQTPRPAPEKGGWSTPVLIQAGDHQELVLNGEAKVIAYDPLTGKQLWSCKAFAGRGEPTVAFGKGLVYVVNGLAGDIYSIRPGGSGDVTKSHMAWHTPRTGGRDQPSPILLNNDLVVVNMGGIATSYDGTTGKERWKDRLRGAFTASPIAAGKYLYYVSEAGDTFVIDPSGPKMNLVAENSLNTPSNELFRSSPAVSHGQIFLRSQTNLYCIGK